MNLKVGQKIKILDMYSNTSYNNRVGTITRFGELGELYGTWGREPLLPNVDLFILVESR